MGRVKAVGITTIFPSKTEAHADSDNVVEPAPECWMQEKEIVVCLGLYVASSKQSDGHMSEEDAGHSQKAKKSQLMNDCTTS